MRGKKGMSIAITDRRVHIEFSRVQTWLFAVPSTTRDGRCERATRRGLAVELPTIAVQFHYELVNISL
jgi:hypothetical protein